LTYQEEDAQFPQQAEKVRKAKERYVEKGFDNLTALAGMLELNPEYLKKRATDEQWREIRYQWLRMMPSEENDALRAKLEQERDPLVRHQITSDFIVEQIQSAVEASVNTSDPIELKAIRGRIELLRTAAEATERAVKTAREARGLTAGIPSAGKSKDSEEVVYKVRHESAGSQETA